MDSLNDITRRDYWDCIRSSAKECAEQVKSGEMDRDEASDWIHETADGVDWVIYTYKNFACLWFSDNWEEIDELGSEGLQAENFSQLLAKAAYLAYRTDLEQQVDAELADWDPE